MMQQRRARRGLWIYGLRLEVVVHLTAEAGWSGGANERGDDDVVCWKILGSH